MSPIQQMLLGVGAVAEKTYVDDVFSTFLYKGNGSSQSINNGMDLSSADSDGGMVWIKGRGSSHGQEIFDTVRGALKDIRADRNNEQETLANSLTAFNSNGFSVGSVTGVNQNDISHAAWTFRKAPGFFDVVTYTGNGTAGRQLSHNLGCAPGMVAIKCTSDAHNWSVWHRGLSSNAKTITLNDDAAEFTNDAFNGAAPSSTVIHLSSTNASNASSKTYVAYLWAGGESTAATARSVEFDGSGDYLVTNTSSDYDFGTGDFTIEHWIKPDSFTVAQIIDTRSTTGAGAPLCTFINTDSTYNFNTNGGTRITSTTKLALGVWSHIAIVRSSGTTSLYVNGISQGTYSDSYNYDDERVVIGIHGPNLSSFPFDGKLSNVRVLKGTALYTSSFRPPTEPLTSITNTKLLCCNNSSITGTTTGTVTSGGDPTASTDSPFDDPAAFTFGDAGDQNVIKCGSYVGNGSSTGPEINLGWEPQYILIKNTTTSGTGWRLFDSMRGIVTGGDGEVLYPNLTSNADSVNRLSLTSTGFKLTSTHFATNEDGSNFVFMCIRRPDGYCGKPPELGSDCFAMDTGSSSSTIPTWDSGFPVDFALAKEYAATANWWTIARLTGKQLLQPNVTNAEVDGGANWVADSNAGWGKSYDSSNFSWIWKRHAGFDVVCWDGNSNSNRVLNHSMNASPEMIWYKRRDATDYWGVGVNFTNSDFRFLQLNSNSSGSTISYTARFKSKPTSTSFEIGHDTNINGTGGKYIAMLFASVDGISKVGSYTGNGSSTARTISLGFQPRFIIIKQSAGGTNWWIVLDTTRGWSSGNDNWLGLNSSNAQDSYDLGEPTSTGFQINTDDSSVNQNNTTYIYYAHA